MKFKFLIYVTFFIGISSCSNNIEGYPIVKIPIFFESNIPINDKQSEIKFAIKANSYEAHRLSLLNMNVQRGSVTLYGENGKIVFLPQKKIKIIIPSYEVDSIYNFNKNLYFNGHNLYWTNIIDEPPIIDLNQISNRDFKYHYKYGLKLDHIIKQGYWFIKIPIEISNDYQGDSIQFLINPNYPWYDF